MRGPERRRTLVVQVEHDPLAECRYCGGGGWLPVVGDMSPWPSSTWVELCPCREDRHSTPTAADLLLDPRVAALVRAVRKEVDDGHAALSLAEALAPFMPGGVE